MKLIFCFILLDWIHKADDYRMRIFNVFWILVGEIRFELQKRLLLKLLNLQRLPRGKQPITSLKHSKGYTTLLWVL